MYGAEAVHIECDGAHMAVRRMSFAFPEYQYCVPDRRGMWFVVGVGEFCQALRDVTDGEGHDVRILVSSEGIRICGCAGELVLRVRRSGECGDMAVDVDARYLRDVLDAMSYGGGGGGIYRRWEIGDCYVRGGQYEEPFRGDAAGAWMSCQAVVKCIERKGTHMELYSYLTKRAVNPIGTE